MHEILWGSKRTADCRVFPSLGIRTIKKSQRSLIHWVYCPIQNEPLYTGQNIIKQNLPENRIKFNSDHLPFEPDLDECILRPIAGTNTTASLADCQQTCINTDASFQCDCRKGYVLMYDKKRCQGKTFRAVLF